MRFTPDPKLAPRWRWLLAACILVGIIAEGTLGWRKYRGVLESRRVEAVHKIERDAQQQTTLAQIDRLAPDAPLERWLPYTSMVGMPSVIVRARDIIRARPHLTYDLVGCLRRDDAPTRALVLGFVRGGGLPALSQESIPAARDALGAEAISMRTRSEAQPDLSAAAFDPECLEAVFLVARYPGHEAAFVAPLREMRTVLDQLPRSQPTPAGQEELDRWLDLNDPRKTH